MSPFSLPIYVEEATPHKKHFPQGNMVLIIGIIVLVIAISAVLVVRSQTKEESSPGLTPEITKTVSPLPTNNTAKPTVSPTGVSSNNGIDDQSLNSDLNSLDQSAAQVDANMQQIDQGLNDQSGNLQ